VQKVSLFAALVGGLLMCSTPLLAQSTTTTAPAVVPAATAPAAQPAPQDDPNEMICKSGEPILGSRFPGPRVCRTRKEWDQIRRDSQDALYHQQMNRAGPGGP